LKTGITLAILNLLGTTPVDIEQLNMHSRGFDINVFNNFNIFIGVLEGPVAFEDLSKYCLVVYLANRTLQAY
jgi:hypothetical protein